MAAAAWANPGPGGLAPHSGRQDVGLARMEVTCVAELRGHNERVWCARWSPNGTMLATCGGDQTIRLWARDGVGQWVCRHALTGMHSRTVRRCAWDPPGRHLATASFDGTVGVWDTSLPEVECIATLEGHENEVKDVAYSPSGALLASCGRDKSVWVWEVLEDGDFECAAVLREHTQDVKTVVWHPAHEVLYSASYDDTIRAWSADADGEWVCAATMRAHSSTVWSLAFGAEGGRLFSVSDDCTLVVWAPSASGGDERGAALPPAAYEPVATVSGAHSRAIFCVDASATSGLVATAAADDTVRILAPGGGGAAYEVRHAQHAAHRGDVNCVAWNPTDPELLCSTGDDRIVRMWTVREASGGARSGMQS